MRITKTEFANLSKAVVGYREGLAGKVTVADEDDFISWGMEALKSAGDTVEIPSRFCSLLRQFQRSEHYVLDADSILLEAEKKGNPFARTPSTSPTNEGTNMRESFLEKFGQLTGTTKSAFERLEFARRGESETELERAVRRALRSLAHERKMAETDPIGAVLDANPELVFISTQWRVLWAAPGWTASKPRWWMN
jgi:hypothetical protein